MNYYCCKDNVGVRIYLVNALQFHLPICCILLCGMSIAVAEVAAPIRKLWDLKCTVDRFAKLIEVSNHCEKAELVTGAWVLGSIIKRAPGILLIAS